MTTAARLAVADTGVAEGHVLRRIESIGTVHTISLNSPDLGRLLAARLGASPDETVTTHIGGTSPVDLLADACGRIATGGLRVALLAGAETVKARQEGRLSQPPEQPTGTHPDRTLGSDRLPSHPAEEAVGLRFPLQYYPLFENAVRAAAGREIAAHEDRIARLWARFAEVAKSNPHAWDTSGPDARTIGTTGPRNRMVTYPYRKLTTANIAVDQGAALLLCSAEAADELGVPRERWVFVTATGSAEDHFYVGERAELHRSPAIGAIGRAVLDHARIGIDDVAHLDLYSCFPSAVQITAAELGIDLDDRHRPPTVTGGLTFAGGPGSNYTMHSLATLVGRIRERPETFGLATAVSWFLTKHAAALLTGRPPARAYGHHRVQGAVNRGPKVAVAVDFRGRAIVETYTVSFDRRGAPATARVACLLDDGRRAFGRTKEPEVVASMLARDPIGETVTLVPQSRFV